jgi:hypothetical protein
MNQMSLCAYKDNRHLGEEAALAASNMDDQEGRDMIAALRAAVKKHNEKFLQSN